MNQRELSSGIERLLARQAGAKLEGLYGLSGLSGVDSIDELESLCEEAGLSGNLFKKLGKSLKKVGKKIEKAVKKALPVAALVANIIPGVGQAVSLGISAGAASRKAKDAKKAAKSAATLADIITRHNAGQPLTAAEQKKLDAQMKKQAKADAKAAKKVAKLDAKAAKAAAKLAAKKAKLLGTAATAIENVAAVVPPGTEMTPAQVGAAVLEQQSGVQFASPEAQQFAQSAVSGGGGGASYPALSEPAAETSVEPAGFLDAVPKPVLYAGGALGLFLIAKASGMMGRR